MTRENMVFFHAEHQTFSTVPETQGEFPPDLEWALAYHVTDLPRKTSLLERKGQSLPAQADLVRVDPFALICGWVPVPDSENLAPEIWKFILPPVEEMQCLNIRQSIFDLNLDLQCFVAVGGRFLLLGTTDSLVYNVCIEIDPRAFGDGG